MIKNYIVVNDCAILFIPHKGTIKEVYIDAEDLERVLSFPYAWGVIYAPNFKGYYSVSTVYNGMINGKPSYNPLRMHKFIMNYKGNNKVDHINYNGLDNRKRNLRITSQDENLKHRSGKNSNNTSGYRNVTWDKEMKKWKVQLYLNGTNKIFGYFSDIIEAAKCAKEVRQKHYGKFAGAG